MNIEYGWRYDPRSHELLLRTCQNLRELGGYDCAYGVTKMRRFLRSGATRGIGTKDLQFLRDEGVTRVLDLRSRGEEPAVTCAFSRVPWAMWENVPLFDYDLSAPAMMPVRDVDNYLVTSYLRILTNEEALRGALVFLAQTPPDECALFHCAAGMDRTGMVALLLLGLADVPREQIVADYLYSFASPAQVDRVVFGGEEPRVAAGSWNPLPSRKEAVEFVLDRIGEGYGSTRAYLAACGIDGGSLDAVKGMLVGLDAPDA
jgi:protein-tyrosine phosphatase